MNRSQLEHILRAAAAITGGDQFVVVGSQAILGQCIAPPPELIESMEADLFSARSTDDAELIDGSIGELSPFHRTFGFYAHGVSESTATLPPGWKDRLVPFRTANTGGATGLCVELHDLAVSKLVAGRPKDVEYVAALIRHGLAQRDTILDRLRVTPLVEQVREACMMRLQRVAD